VIHLPEDMPDSPPVDNNYRAAVWLVGRHPMLSRLVDRVPGAVDADGDLKLDVLGDAIRALDAYHRAWAKYRATTWEPNQDEAWGRWADAGPSLDDFGPRGAVAALAVMSRAEGARLRLLATLGFERVEFCVSDLDGFDAYGLRLIRDWCRILTAGPSPEDLDAIDASLRQGVPSGLLGGQEHSDE
jgi:hypothetical protein